MRSPAQSRTMPSAQARRLQGWAGNAWHTLAQLNKNWALLGWWCSHRGAACSVRQYSLWCEIAYLRSSARGRAFAQPFTLATGTHQLRRCSHRAPMWVAYSGQTILDVA
jgi:hypothetical protein